MKNGFLKSFFLTPQFYIAGLAIILLFAFGFAFSILFLIAKALLVLLFSLLIADGFLLYRSVIRLTANRKIGRILGIGDETPIEIQIMYRGNISLQAKLIDELPTELQERHFQIEIPLEPGLNQVSYSITPITKGIYSFGRLNVFIESPIHLGRRRIALPIERKVPVYPSVAQMHRLELVAFSRVSTLQGAKKYRRIGQSYEFEQIAPFVEGDDYRNINWKATGKTRELMVNQYQEERSQNMYCIISKGRTMKMAFQNISYLDYAINSTLAISNIALKKYDRVGLITFSDKIGTALRAENRQGQLQKILESLYHEKERQLEPSYELLYQSISRIIKSRSLLLLYANFENPKDLNRVLPILRRINKKHVLVLILFEDEELSMRAAQKANTVSQIYQLTLARQYQSEKREMATHLHRQGIQTIVSTPKTLSLEVINKYMELKSRGII